MLLDTNIVIRYIRQNQPVPARTIISVIVAAELESIALRAAWGRQKLHNMQAILERHKPIELSVDLVPTYARLDAYSQGKLPGQALPPGMSARNMGKNDLWLATTAFYFQVPFYTTDRDFDHLAIVGLQLGNPEDLA